MARLLYVAVALITNEQGQFLVAQRPQNVDHAGCWEFPGGKLAPYETGYQALKREIQEEVGVTIQAARPFLRLKHRYPDKRVLLDVWKVLKYDGEPWGREGQPIAWRSFNELSSLAFPEANLPILQSLALPSRLAITAELDQLDQGLAQLDRVLDSGIRLVQLRAPEMDAATYHQWAEAFIKKCHQRSARLILNADPGLLHTLDADGVHLNQQRLHQFSSRPIPKDRLLSVACHSLADLEQAKHLNANLALVSPVNPTPSHLEAAPLYWQGFKSLTEQACVPVFALGGMRLEDRKKVFALGGQGVAGIHHFWLNPSSSS